MSKHLIKILSICALVVLVPMIIVGSALCVTEAAPVKLTIFQGGEIYGVDENDYPTAVTLQIENESPVTVEFGKTITVKKNSLITLNYSGNTVYDFDGWYIGTNQQITDTAKAQELASEYQFRIRNNTNITAVKNIKKFDIVYSGFYDDGVTPIEYETDLVSYGTPLFVPNSVEGAVFEGWYIDSEYTANTTVYNNATFAVDNRDANNNYIEITLKPVWSNLMTLTYYDSDKQTVISQEILSENEYNSYTLLTSDNALVANALTPGYEFNAWLYNDSPITSISQIPFVEGTDVNLYLQETKIEIAQITYYASDETTVIAQFNLRENEYLSHELLSSLDERVIAKIPAGYEFNSWTVEGIPVTSISQIPFVDGEIKIVLRVSELPYTLITYYTSLDNGETISQVKLYEDEFNTYNLLTGSDQVVQDALVSGYGFAGWANETGETVTKDDLTFGENYNLYIQTNLIRYNVNVQFNAIDTNQVDVITYDVQNNFSNYAITRTGYTFVGLVYNGNTYTLSGKDYIYNGHTLGEEVIANNGLTVTALWQVDETYGQYDWTVGFGYENNGLMGVYALNNNGEYTLIDDINEYVIFEDNQSVGFRQLEDNIIDTYFNGLDLNNLYVKVGDVYSKVNVSSMYVYVDNMLISASYDDALNATFKDAIETAYNIGVDDFTKITVTIICEIA